MNHLLLICSLVCFVPMVKAGGTTAPVMQKNPPIENSQPKADELGQIRATVYAERAIANARAAGSSPANTHHRRHANSIVDFTRFKIRDVNIGGSGSHYLGQPGEVVWVTMSVLHDCGFCNNAINQVIIGLSSEHKAQISVWNGKQRSGGAIYTINPRSSVQTYGQDNRGEAEWVKVRYSLRLPKTPGKYDVRARYAQAYTGNILTEKGRSLNQKIAQEPLMWWKVDRPNGPSAKANIGHVSVASLR